MNTNRRGEVIKRFVGFDDEIRQAAISPDGQRLAVVACLVDTEFFLLSP